MTRNEWMIFGAVGSLAIIVMFYVWPNPNPYPSSGYVEREALEKFLRSQRKQNPRERRTKQSDTLLEDMEKAAKKMTEQFDPERDKILKAARKGELPAVEPYDRDLPFPDETVAVHMNLELDGVATTDREKGRARVFIAGLESMCFDKADKSGTDYEQLAAVLAALEIRRQTDSGQSITVVLIPLAFVPFEDVKKAVEAAARAGITRIQLKQSPLPN